MTLHSQQERRVWTRQPQVATGVNWANPLSVGLVFAAYGGGPDIVSGTLPTYGGGAGRTTISDGVASAAGAGSVTYALPSGHNLYNITTTDTVFASERIDTVAAYGCLCIVEYRQAGGSPYIAWGYTSDGLGTSPQDWIASNGSTFSDGQTASARISAAPKVSHGKVRTTTETRYFVNGEVVETKSRAAITPDFVNKRPLVVGNAGNAVSVLLIWNRPLSDLEYKKVHNNPWQLFARRRTRRYISLGAGGGANFLTLSATTTSSAAIIKAARAQRAATETASAAIAKAVASSKAATTTASATLTRSARLIRSATATATAVFVKLAAATRSATSTATAALATIKAKLLTLSASVTSSATVRRATSATRSATTTAAGTLVKAARAVKSAAATASGAVVKVAASTKAASTTITASVATLKAKLLTLVATVTTSAAVSWIFTGGGAFIASLRRMFSPNRDKTFDSPDRSIAIVSPDRATTLASPPRNEI